ncbi:MAG: glucosidase [Elusimicrobia bacterium]|nr:glucosidase [Elusimicrobiota bacterium]
MSATDDPEAARLAEDAARAANWRRWGAYLSGRQWGTVREDYSAGGDCWDYFPHDHARSRAYRWGEDGLLGLCDREGRLCFSPALWNGRDPILKERLFGLTNAEGNHGEDVKEAYFHLDATPTQSYLKASYRYPQAEFPYARLVAENARRGLAEPEFELEDCGVFDEGRWFGLTVEYAKASPDDVLIRLTVENRGPEAAELAVLPTLWFRNAWSWGRTGEDDAVRRPSLRRAGRGEVAAEHATLGRFRLSADAGPDGAAPELLFTGNETNFRRLYGTPNPSPHVKDAFHEYVIRGDRSAVDPSGSGTKAAALYRLRLPPGGRAVLRLRLRPEDEVGSPAFGAGFDAVFAERIAEADRFYARRLPVALSPDERAAARRAYAGLLWSRQFYEYVVADWLDGDPAQPAPPPGRARNRDWGHLFARDVLSMPDTWEYPWFASWDLAFHCVALAGVDPEFAKSQLVLLLREWYMRADGQIPAYEFAFSDANPPVHAWAAWRVYKIAAAKGKRDRVFLSRVFQKLVLNFTWWVNRKDVRGDALFDGGFLGLDNISAFDRSKPLPGGAVLEEADGTAWMAFYCATMLAIALELAEENPAYEDMATKFLDHFVAIADAMNEACCGGLWDEADGFYYSRVRADGDERPVRLRSLVGLIPLLAAAVFDEADLRRHAGFWERYEWLAAHRPDLARFASFLAPGEGDAAGRRLLAAPTKDRLARVLARVFDEAEFLSPHGVRSLSKAYAAAPFSTELCGERREVRYAPGEGDSRAFGGNSNWRGPVWMPLNYMLVEALEAYGRFYGDALTVELPAGSGRRATLAEAARELSSRLSGLFLSDASGARPFLAGTRLARDPAWKDEVNFHEYFHGETGKGLGASHQTGWTALAARLIADRAKGRRPS